MTDKVISLAERRPAVNADVVDKLEEMLERARSGETVAVAIAATSRDGYGQTLWSTAENTVLLLGAVSLLATRIGRGLDEGCEPDPSPGCS